MKRMLVWAAIVFLAGGCMSMADDSVALLSTDDMAFLRELTAEVVEASRVQPGAMVGAIGPNTTGGTLIRPGGRDCYPAFWIRDYAMSLESGLITPDEQLHALLLTARLQSDEERVLSSGSVLVPGSIADHITFDGKPIFYPGVLDDFEGQGGTQWGRLPCLDDQFFFVTMAESYVSAVSDTSILLRDVNGKPLIQRLEDAFAMPPSRADTHLVSVPPDNRGVSFGFFDTVVHTGDLLFASVLKHDAAVSLAGLERKLGRNDAADRYENVAKDIRKALVPTFGDASGLLRASTGTGAQLDVWGTAYAVYTGALLEADERRACEALARECAAGTIAWKGMIRHVPTTGDFSASSAWERAYTKLNTYQNGAYWATPTGWVCHAVAKVDLEGARKLAGEYVGHLRSDDFRQGAEHGAPWECEHPENEHRQNPVYMASVTCPLAAFSR